MPRKILNQVWTDRCPAFKPRTWTFTSFTGAVSRTLTSTLKTEGPQAGRFQEGALRERGKDRD